MATLVCGMNQSLDGYIDHEEFAPDDDLFRYFIEEARQQAGSIYGRRMYEVMRYWDDDDPDWSSDDHAFADAWRAQHKWVVSRTLASVGPNAELISADVDETVRRIKDGHDGQVEVAGPTLAHSLAPGLVDEFRIYLHPVVLGHGRPFFTGARPPLHLVSVDPMGEVVRLVYAPA